MAIVSRLPAKSLVGLIIWALMLWCLAYVGCTTFVVKVSIPPERPPSGTFQAGNGRADITPSAGYPFFGYSLGGKHLSQGFQTRLYARAFYLEDADGEAVALVQCDLGAVSAALHRQVAALVAPKIGLGPDRILLAATHTHSAPGGYFGISFYNSWGGKEPGFDPGLFHFLSERIAQSILDAYHNRGPASAAVGTCEIDSVTYNRSLAACLANFGDFEIDQSDIADGPVDKRLTLLRIDRITPNGTRPLGAWTNFAIHGTAIGPDNDLYNADCFGAAERYFEAAIRSRDRLADSDIVIHALTTGMTGDVAPAFERNRRGFDEAHRLGRRIAESAFDLFNKLDDSMSSTIQIQHAYREISLRHTFTSTGGAELAPPRLGSPVTGGTEDGYTPFHFVWPGAEGSRAKAADLSFGRIGVSLLAGPFSWNGQDSAKIFAGGGLHDHLLPESVFPQLMTLQTIRIGDLLLVTVPGEITTMMGLAAAQKCSTAAQVQPEIKRIAIVSQANQYMSYFTTPAEYNAQHYEGAHSIWGEHAGEFVADELAILVKQMIDGEFSPPPDQWSFSPGIHHQFAAWKPGQRNPLLVDTVLIDTTLQGKHRISVFWWDQKTEHLDLTAFHWRIEVPGRNGGWRIYRTTGLTGGEELPADDSGCDFTIAECGAETKKITRRLGINKPPEKNRRALWRVCWIPSKLPPSRFRFVMYDCPEGQRILTKEVAAGTQGR